MTAQTWRVVLDDGATKDVSVVSFGLLRWVVAGAQSANVRNSPRDAVAAVWSNIVEIRGPGELTTAEAVAAETARCAALCDKLQETVHPHFAPWAACRDCAKAIRRDPSLPPDCVGCRTPTTCLAPDGHTPLCMECRDDGDDSDESEVPQ